MSDITARYDDAAAGLATGAPGDFVALLKPRVMSLVIFTAFAGLVAAPGHLNPVLAFASLLAIAVGAGASGALNMWWDADIDAIMSRTRGRPIPSGRVAPREALAFGMVLSVFAVFTLGVAANWLAAGLLAFTIFFYAVVYTMWLKRWTPQNIVIGGAAGAFPPMIGWAAASGQISAASIALFCIIFFWTPPHFWALALFKQTDYGRAGVPMMPNVKGADHTRFLILAYSILLAPIALSPAFLGLEGKLYAGIAAISSAIMIYFAVKVYRTRQGKEADKAAGQLFGYSILHLFLLFAVIVAERGVGAVLGHLQ
ncbi:MAG: heme o synthase [Hyphomicrobiales bacterium]|nr:heme o synthase [Hyphomicrobiales bacterium]